jgi:hypothetical protein
MTISSAQTQVRHTALVAGRTANANCEDEAAAAAATTKAGMVGFSLMKLDDF